MNDNCATWVSLAACGGGSSGTSSGLGGATSVTGTCLSASGDPIPSVTVYIPGTTVAPMVATKATRTFKTATPAADGTTCEDPVAADSSLIAVCTGADGTFSMDTSAITASVSQIVFVRGSLRMVQTLACTTNPCALGTDITKFGSGSNTTTWPRVAVVTGSWDRMEDVLAKLADSNTGDDTNGSYGRVSATSGTFVYGSESGTNLTIIDGTGSSAPTENASTIGTYKTWASYLDGTNALLSGSSPVFDVVFINCGNAYDDVSHITAASNTILQNYVNAGGRLYVTDLSYDFVEQPFPEVMKFENDPDSTTTPGTIGAAETGTSGLELDATVGQSAMLSWLGGSVAVNRHDASTPGNPKNDCSGLVTYDQYAHAVTTSNLIPVDDFLGDWAHMTGRHTGDTTTTIWISSGASNTFDGLADRPLTVSRTVGSNSGKVVYSSYHTAHTCPTLTFWPQERVLQYLMLEAF